MTAPFYPAAARPLLDVIQQNGAQGDGLTDDWAALTAALAFSAKYGYQAYLPPVTASGAATVFAIGQPLVMPAGATLLGEDYGTGTRGILKPLVPMSCALRLTGRALVQRVVVNGSAKATDGIQLMGAARSRIDGCYVTGCVRNGIRAAVAAGAVTLGAVTQTGPGPTMTVSQPDGTLSQFANGTKYLRVKAGGATWELSQDGVSFSGTYSLATTLQIPFVNGAFVYSDSGLRCAFSGTGWVAGTVYQFAFSTPGVNANNRVFCVDTEASGNGRVWATSGLSSSYVNFTGILQTASGTVSTTNGSSRITFSGAQSLSTLARDGDMLYIPGAHFASPQGGTSDMTMVCCVLSDNEAEVDLQAGATLSGAQYAWGSGAGFRTDPGQSHANRPRYDQCYATGNPVGYVDQGLVGGIYTSCYWGGNSHAGRCNGTRSSD